jgi:hypothetical protein
LAAVRTIVVRGSTAIILLASSVWIGVALILKLLKIVDIIFLGGRNFFLGLWLSSGHSKLVELLFGIFCHRPCRYPIHVQIQVDFPIWLIWSLLCRIINRLRNRWLVGVNSVTSFVPSRNDAYKSNQKDYDPHNDFCRTAHFEDQEHSESDEASTADLGIQEVEIESRPFTLEFRCDDQSQEDELIDREDDEECDPVLCDRFY